MCQFYYVHNTYYLKLDNQFSPRTIVKALSVKTGMRKGSFAEKVVLDLFIELLSNSENLVEIYHLFYHQEYVTLEDFLFKKELIEFSDIQSFSIGDNDSFWKLHLPRKRNSIKNLIGYDNENIMCLNSMLKVIINES